MTTFITIAIFFTLSLVNVILSTIKSIITVKGTAFQSALSNAIFYGFYTLIIKYIANTNLIITVPIIILTNFIGVYIANWLLKLLKKDRLWRVTCVITNVTQNEYNNLIEELRKYNFEFSCIDEDFIDIISNTQQESKILKELLKGYKTYVIEIEKSL